MSDADASRQRQREEPEHAPPQVVLQTLSSIAGTMLGEVLGSSLTGKLLAGAVGALVGTFLTARGSHQTRRIVAVALLLVLLDALHGAASALAAVARRGAADSSAHRSGQRDVTSHATSTRGGIPPEPRGGLVPRQPILTLVIAVAGFAVGTGSIAVAGGLKNSTRTIQRASTASHTRIPNVVGHRASRAVAILKAHDFTATIHGRKASHGDDGRVLAQSPSPGQSRPRGSTVVLTIAISPNDLSTVLRPDGHSRAQVPNVVGLPLEQAVNRLDSWFGTTVTTVESAVTANQVLAQKPRAGGIASLGSVISLVISSGASVSRVIVPAVAGLELQAAAGKLQAVGLRAGVVRESSETVPPGVVIGSSPVTGESVGKNTEVTLTVSTELRAPG
jgi:beta-lactam-binding protein with PASTA domain